MKSKPKYIMEKKEALGEPALLTLVTSGKTPKKIRVFS
jgi:hypothetical protein